MSIVGLTPALMGDSFIFTPSAGLGALVALRASF